jgi:hypothetical protein
MGDVVTQVLYQVGIWIVCDDYLGSAVDCAYQTGKAGPGAELEYRVVLDELACMLLEIIRKCAACIPKKMALFKSALANGSDNLQGWRSNGPCRSIVSGNL